MVDLKPGPSCYKTAVLTTTPTPVILMTGLMGWAVWYKEEGNRLSTVFRRASVKHEGGGEVEVKVNCLRVVDEVNKKSFIKVLAGRQRLKSVCSDGVKARL